MSDDTLKNKPLVEVIFELRWELKVIAKGIKIDPHYKIIVGRIYDKIMSEYQYHEQLPTSTMPDEIAGYVLQHRFRKKQNGWPLIQIGPGILTVNDTDGYEWMDYKERIIKAVNALFEIYPDATNNLKINRLLLRYIDAIDFDYTNNVLTFLERELKTEIAINQELFKGTNISEIPLGLDARFDFQSNRPKGAAHLRFSRGKKYQADSLIMETMVQSINNDAPNDKNQITEWIESAHKITHDWFFKLIEGDLKRKFQ